MVVYVNGKPIFVQNSTLATGGMNSEAPTRIRIPYTEVDKPSVISTQVDSKTTTSDDDEYLQVVSMFRQKNEKLFNPLNSSI